MSKCWWFSFTSACTWVTVSGQPRRLLAHGGAAPAAVILLQAALFWAPLTPIFMLPNSTSMFNLRLRLKGINFQLEKVRFFLSLLLSTLPTVGGAPET